MQFLSFSFSSSSLPWRQFSSNWTSMKWPTILIFFQFKVFTCSPCFLLVVWCVGLSFKFLELFHYSIVKLLQVLCLMTPLKPPSIFKYNVFFGFQLRIFPLKIFPPNFVLLEYSHAPFSTTNHNITSLCNVVTSSHAHFNIINSNVSDYVSNYHQWKYP